MCFNSSAVCDYFLLFLLFVFWENPLVIFQDKEFDSLAQIHKIFGCCLKLCPKSKVHLYRYTSKRQIDFHQKNKKNMAWEMHLVFLTAMS